MPKLFDVKQLSVLFFISGHVYLLLAIQSVHPFFSIETWKYITLCILVV